MASIFAFVAFGIKQGIDLAGGTNWQILINDSAVKESDLKSALKEISGYSDLTVKSLRDGNFIVRFPSISEEDHLKYYQALKEKFGEIGEQSFESIGPTIGQELRRRFVWAFALGLLSILFYVIWAFRRASYPVKSWKYGLVVIFCAFHDIIIPVGLMTFLGWRQGVEIDTNFIVALMFILGYSINDTIIVFDRLRENLSLTNKNNFNFAGLINDSVRQTFSRSVNTSLTTILAILPLYFIGPLSLKYFILTLVLGIITGSYSSIFSLVRFYTFGIAKNEAKLACFFRR